VTPGRFFGHGRAPRSQPHVHGEFEGVLKVLESVCDGRQWQPEGRGFLFEVAGTAYTHAGSRAPEYRAISMAALLFCRCSLSRFAHLAPSMLCRLSSSRNVQVGPYLTCHAPRRPHERGRCRQRIFELISISSRDPLRVRAAVISIARALRHRLRQSEVVAMSVIVTMKISGDTNVFTESLKERGDEFRKVAERGRAAGAIHHQFAVGDGFVLVIDEWESAEASEKFFSDPQLMEFIGSVGADPNSAPEVTAGESIDSPDKF
jgi:hypothetical protein